MSTPRQIRITRDVLIRQTDASNRIVYGELMVPAPDWQPGDTIRQSEMDECVHYDGVFFPADAVKQLAHRALTQRIAVDVGHDNIPRGAQIVESFVAGDGWAEWMPGSHVLGIQIFDEDIWGRVEAGELTAYSAELTVVTVQPVKVTVVDDNGENPQKVTLQRATNPLPSWVTLTGLPANGQHWKAIDRMALPAEDLALAPETTAFNAALAKARIRQWAESAEGEVDVAQYARAFLVGPDDADGGLGSFRLPIADVIGGELVAVPRAIYAAAALITEGRAGFAPSEDDVRAVQSHLERYYRRLDREPPWHQERSVDPVNMTETQTEPTETVTDEPTEAPPEAAVVEEAEPVGAEVKRSFLGWLRRAFKIDGDPSDAEVVQLVREHTTFAERNTPAEKVFAEAWRGFELLWDTLYAVVWDDEADKPAAMTKAVDEYAAFLKRCISDAHAMDREVLRTVTRAMKDGARFSPSIEPIEGASAVDLDAIATATAEIKRAADALAEAQASPDAKTQIADLKRQVEEGGTALDAAKAETAETLTRATEAEAKVTDLETAAAEKDTRITELERELAKYQRAAEPPSGDPEPAPDTQPAPKTSLTSHDMRRALLGD
ncbi:MAG: XkdF-like putative serine protease domain-containing protein [Planctomycetota bacterium]